MKLVHQIANRYFSPEYLIKKEKRCGDIPKTKEAYSNFIRMAWPAMLESLMVSLISFVDTIMVGTRGDNAIAAVGITNQPRMLFYAVFFALSTGVLVLVSRRCGECDRKSANEVLAQAVNLCLLLGATLCTLAFCVAEPLLIFSGAEPHILSDAVVYFKITMVGLCFSSLSLVINAAQRASGNTKIAMRTTVIANVVNVIFNYFLINGHWFFPELGVAGAAIATMFGNICACAISIMSVVKKDKFLHIRIKDCIKIKPAHLKQLVRIGSGSGAEQICLRVGFFLFAKVVAELGTTSWATHHICMTIIGLSFAFGDGLGVAASALVGQNLGKCRPDLSLLYGKAAQRIGFIISAGLFILFTSAGGLLMRMFTSDPVIIRNGIGILIIVAFVSPAQITQVIFSGCLRGAGDTKYIAVISLFSTALVRPVIAYLLCYPLGLGLAGAWLGLMLDQYFRLSASALRFIRGKWVKIKV